MSLALLLSACDACSGPQDTLAAGGPAAAEIAALSWWVLGTFVVVTVVMWGLVFWAAARRKGTLTSHLAFDAPEDLSAGSSSEGSRYRW
ncbi:MAG: hypothetical protein QM736_01460 [Vicinamibacterales bacterium]